MKALTKNRPSEAETRCCVSEHTKDDGETYTRKCRDI